jgi:hypothetical protein
MAYDKIERLASLLYEKSKRGEIKWEATADENAFQTSLSNYSVIVVQDSDEAFGHDVVLKICNEQGRVMEELPQSESNELGSLFELARRTAMGVEAALDEILTALESPAPKRA